MCSKLAGGLTQGCRTNTRVCVDDVIQLGCAATDGDDQNGLGYGSIMSG